MPPAAGTEKGIEEIEGEKILVAQISTVEDGDVAFPVQTNQFILIG